MDEGVNAAFHQLLIEHLERTGDTALDRVHLTALARERMTHADVTIPAELRDAVVEAVVDKIVGWGALTPLLADPTITEIMVNGIASLFIERDGVLMRIPPCFTSRDEVLHIINRMVGIVGRRIDTASPMVDARLPDGSRINAIIEPLSLIGPVLTIRRFPAVPLSLALLVERGAATAEIAEFLRMAIRAKCNIVVSGGTGSGKTTMLNALASCIPDNERIITIEDAAEMRLSHPHLISLESRPSNIEGRGEVGIRTLLKNALRMRPDRIIVGEIRGGEALDMLQAMNTGHQGSVTTVHANAPLEALLRIETMTLMADVDLPLHAIRAQIRQAIHLLVHIERFRDGRRRIIAIDFLSPAADRDDPYTLSPVFTFDRAVQTYRAHPLPPALARFFSDAV